MNEGRAEAIVLLRVVNSGQTTDVFKSSVGFLMIESVTFSGQTTRTKHYRHAAKPTEVLFQARRSGNFARTWGEIVEIDLNIPGNKEVQPSVSVVVSPTCSRTPA